jgi:hypothetical protein
MATPTPTPSQTAWCSISVRLRQQRFSLSEISFEMATASRCRELIIRCDPKAELRPPGKKDA